MKDPMPINLNLTPDENKALDEFLDLASGDVWEEKEVPYPNLSIGAVTDCLRGLNMAAFNDAIEHIKEQKAKNPNFKFTYFLNGEKITI